MTANGTLIVIFGGITDFTTSTESINQNVYAARWGGSSLTFQTIAVPGVNGSAPGRIDHSAVLCQSFNQSSPSIIYWGGFNGAYLNDMWELVLSPYAWVARPQSGGSRPSQRYSHTAVMLPPTAGGGGGGPHHMVVFAGANMHGAPLSSLHHYDVMGDAWTTVPQTGPWPLPRSSHSATAIPSDVHSRGCMLVFGGWNPETTIIYSDLWRYCPQSAPLWAQLSPSSTFLPSRSHGHRSLLVAGRLLLVGGFSNQNFPRDYPQHLREYDVFLNSWSQPDMRGSPPAGRILHQVVAVDGLLLLHGGQDRYKALSDMASSNYSGALCTAGYFNPLLLFPTTTNTDCRQCAAGKFSAAGAYNCTPCAAGTFNPTPGSGSCQPCPGGTYGIAIGAQAVTSCLTCGAGKYSTGGGGSSSHCQDCPAGTVSSGGVAQCTDCTAGSHSGGGASVCAPCQPGTFSGNRAGVCSSCAPGDYGPYPSMSACFMCPAGQYSTGSATACTPCGRGTASRLPRATSALSCTACVAGKYAAAEGQTTCDDCAVGTSSATVAATAQSVCLPCAPGSASAVAALGTATCPPCAPGTFANVSGSTSCHRCAQGTFSETSGANSSNTCIACPHGTRTATDGVASALGCVGCSNGTFGDALTGGCEPCAAGTSQSYVSVNQPAAPSCDACPPMHSAPPGAAACSHCGVGSYSQQGWEECAPCDDAGSCVTGGNGQPCSGHGSCAFGACVCSAGWSLSDCSLGTCPLCTGWLLFDRALYVDIEGGSFTVTVLRSAGSAGAATALLHILPTPPAATTAAAATLRTTAAADTDVVTAAYPIALSFADGQLSATVSLPVQDDAVVGEGCESFSLQLTNATGAALGRRVTAAVLIRDNDFAGAVVSSTSSPLLNPTTAEVLVGSVPFSLTVAVFVPAVNTNDLPLDLLIIQDLSGSYMNDLVQMRLLLPNLFADLQTNYPDPWFGVTSFVDKPVSFLDFFGTTHNFGRVSGYEFRTDIALTPDAIKVQNKYQSLTANGGADGPESQLTALLSVATRLSEVGFRPHSRRVVVLCTDNLFHQAGDYTRLISALGGRACTAASQCPFSRCLSGFCAPAPNNGDGVLDGDGDGDGTPDGAGEDYPSVQQVRSALLAANIVPVFAVTPDFQFVWDALVSALGFGVVVSLTTDSSNIIAAINQGLSAITREVTLIKEQDSSNSVLSITPATHSGVDPGASGVTLSFQVTLQPSPPTCSPPADASDAAAAAYIACLATPNAVALNVLGFGAVSLSLSHFTDVCAADLPAPTADPVSWAGWMRNYRFSALRASATGSAQAADGGGAESPALHWIAAQGSYSVAQVVTHTGDSGYALALPAAAATHVTQQASVSFTNLLPLVLRGFSKASSLPSPASLAASPAAHALHLDIVYADGSAQPSALLLPFNVTHTAPRTGFGADGGWAAVHAVFYPSKLVASATLRAVFDGTQRAGEAWFSGMGLLSLPAASCGCADGYYFEANRRRAGVLSLDFASAVCVRCPAGSFCVGGVRSRCPHPLFSFGGASACQPCLPGWICTNGTATPCDAQAGLLAGGTSRSGRLRADAVAAKTHRRVYATADGACAPCPPHSLCLGGRAMRCPAGTRPHAPTGRHCLLCEPGTFSNASTAGVGGGACLPCAAGTTSAVMRDYCFPCPLGHVTDAPGRYPCRSCAPGSFANVTGSSICHPCPRGTYAHTYGARECVPCPPHANSTAATGATSAADCIPPSAPMLP